ncbi:MAG: HEAT repeat domain-containing protein, partial [Candidatus Eremiobacterota bacterium]
VPEPQEEKISDKIPVPEPQEEKISDKIPVPEVQEEKISDKIPVPEVQEEKKYVDEHMYKYIKDLNNPSSLVRLKTVIKLGETGSEEASEALIAKLKSGDKADIRWRIIESLGKLNKSNSAEVLITFLKTEIPDIKIKIIETLALLGDKKAVKPVTEELKSELSVKLAAIETLGMLGDKEIVPNLIRELEDKDPTVRIRTVEALGRLGDRLAIDPIKNARKKEGIFSIIMKSTMASVIKKLENN